MSVVAEVRSIARALRMRRSRPGRDDPLGVRRPEREMLAGFLDWYRQVVVNKLDGLPLADASREMTATRLSPLGVVKHLTWAEAGWFRETFVGEDAGREGGVDESFRVVPRDTVESVVAAYRAECDRSRRVVAEAPSLDGGAARPHPLLGQVSMRWILVHMIEETARHAGHLDLMREQLDGRTGD